MGPHSSNPLEFAEDPEILQNSHPEESSRQGEKNPHIRSGPEPFAAGLQIALVEDNPADIFLFKLALSSAEVGAEIIVMEDGEAGFDFIQQIEEGRVHLPRLFILDMSLPRHNGPELMDRIRRSTACQGVRIIVASSSQSPRDRAAAAEHGADCYFVKPSTFDEFMKISEIVCGLLSS